MVEIADRSRKNAHRCSKGEKIGRKRKCSIGHGRPVRVELSIIPLSTVIPLSHGYMERLLQTRFCRATRTVTVTGDQEPELPAAQATTAGPPCARTLLCASMSLNGPVDRERGTRTRERKRRKKRTCQCVYVCV